MRTLDWNALKRHYFIDREYSPEKQHINSDIEVLHSQEYVDAIMRKLSSDMENLPDDYTEAILFQNIEEFWRVTKELSYYCRSIEFQYSLSVDDLIKTKESVSSLPLIVCFITKTGKACYSNGNKFQYKGHLCYVLNGSSEKKNDLIFEMINDISGKPFEFMTDKFLNLCLLKANRDLKFILPDLLLYSVYSYGALYDMIYKFWMNEYTGPKKRRAIRKRH